MKLKPVLEKPGLWRNPDWKRDEGSGGTFAVVIGVSKYSHLPGGDGETAPENYGLKQLAVSANTAYRFFEWLANDYALSGAPIAECWLLLSPAAIELEARPVLSEHQLLPKFREIKYAVEEWCATMASLDDKSGSLSRAIFFFSGHGFEMAPEENLLLASDYLRPPLHPANEAVNSTNMRRALGIFKVPVQFYFLDACRTDPSGLKKLIASGDPLIDEHRVWAGWKRTAAPVFCAVPTGGRAYQPFKYQENWNASLFGAALLDGLKPDPNVTIGEVDGKSVVSTTALFNFMGDRVRDLLNDSKSSKEQYVELAGSMSKDFPVTEVSTRVTKAPINVHKFAISGYEFPFQMQLDKWDLERLEFSTVSDISFTLEEIVGTKYMADLLRSVRIYSFNKKDSISKNAFQVFNVERDEDDDSYCQIEFYIANSDGPHWLEFDDGVTKIAFVVLDESLNQLDCMVPAPEPVRFLLQLWLETPKNQSAEEDGTKRISQIKVTLSEKNSGPLQVAAQVWNRAKKGRTDQALDLIDRQFSEKVLRYKSESPLAALICAQLLLRTMKLEFLHGSNERPTWIDDNWLRNLCDYFQGVAADAIPLWIEQNLMISNSNNFDLIGELGRIVDRLPFTESSLAYLRAQVSSLEKSACDETIARLHASLHKAITFLKPGGLFCAFKCDTADDGELGYSLMSLSDESNPIPCKT